MKLNMAAMLQKPAITVATFALALLCSSASGASLSSPTPSAVWLDDLPHGFIANPYGPPQARLSFGKTPLRIAGRAFDRGLGTHAPARLELNLDGRATRFTAFVDMDGYCLPFDQRSTFGLLPYALYRDDPGGGRKFGAFFYRWAYVNHEDNEWWNGINSHIASTGAALAKASRLLNQPELGRIAQRQLDFIYGANPFDASTAEGLGRNQPDFFKTTEFVPHTPWISGAIMAGIGSSNDDQPVLLPGWWQTTEYWMESVAHTLLLIRELDHAQSAERRNHR